jgi:chaperonin GroEL
LITTDACVATKPEPKGEGHDHGPPGGGMGGGMGGMGMGGMGGMGM